MYNFCFRTPMLAVSQAAGQEDSMQTRDDGTLSEFSL